MPASIRDRVLSICALAVAGLPLAPVTTALPLYWAATIQARADAASFSDLLARAKAQAAAGHRWAPVGDNMTETLLSMIDLMATATPDQLGELATLLESDPGPPAGGQNQRSPGKQQQAQIPPIPDVPPDQKPAPFATTSISPKLLPDRLGSGGLSQDGLGPITPGPIDPSKIPGDLASPETAMPTPNAAGLASPHPELPSITSPVLDAPAPDAPGQALPEATSPSLASPTPDAAGPASPNPDLPGPPWAGPTLSNPASSSADPPIEPASPSPASVSSASLSPVVPAPTSPGPVAGNPGVSGIGSSSQIGAAPVSASPDLVSPTQVTPSSLAPGPITSGPVAPGLGTSGSGMPGAMTPGPDTPRPSGQASNSRVAALYARGLDAELRGDFSGARRFYLSAAQHGDAGAARNLGRLYDPAYLKQTSFGGINGDPALARQWYERALRLGDSDAGPLLEALSLR